jgi:hypothetical protein
MITEEWKIHQEIYHRLNPAHTDDLSNFDVEISDDIVNNAIKYFKTTNIGWIWPAKSYMVGICYARWLSEVFGGSPIDYLEDPDLLYGNDPNYVTYSTDPKTYHQVLNGIGGWQFDNSLGVVPQVRHYFDLEFGLKE